MVANFQEDFDSSDESPVVVPNVSLGQSAKTMKDQESSGNVLSTPMGTSGLRYMGTLLCPGNFGCSCINFGFTFSSVPIRCE